MDSREIYQNIESFLSTHPKAALQIVAARLGLTQKEIEQAILEVDGSSYEQFRQSRRLAEAFKQLGADRIVPKGPWEITRARPRMIIPKTTVRYRIRTFWIYGRSYSSPCPLVDLSSGGLALLADTAPMPGKRVSLLLKFLDRKEDLRVEGKIAYTIATGIAGYRHRIGIQFLPFGERRGCNSPKVLEALIQFEKQ
jgi:Tfp pilus assembly protein PilZ